MGHKGNKFTDDNRNLLKLKEWQVEVFKESIYYTVVVKAGVARFKTKYYNTYPEAMVIALHTERSLLYAVTEAGRQLLIPPGEYEQYLFLYNKLTGQKLRMPFQPKINPPTAGKRRRGQFNPS